MNFPQLPSQATHPEAEQQKEENWQPSWRCFCCHDSGIVNPHLARLVIPDYKWKRDRLPICQSPSCRLGSRWAHLGNNNLDRRFISAICQQLDMYEREVWRKTVECRAINFRELAQKRAMSGVSERTFNDNREILSRKAEIETITREQWAVMALCLLFREKGGQRWSVLSTNNCSYRLMSSYSR